MVMTDCQVTVERMLRRIGNLAVDKEDLLVDLVDDESQPAELSSTNKAVNMGTPSYP